MAAWVASGLALFVAACAEEQREGCEGVTAHGTCQKKCDESQCVTPGMKCVANACSQPCKTHAECPAGKYCNSTVTDDGVEGSFCELAPFAEADGGTGRYEPCGGDAECDTFHGYSCHDGECRLACTQNLDCAALPGTCAKTETGGSCTQGKAKIGPYQPCTQLDDCDEDLGLGCADGECRVINCKTHLDCAPVGLCQEASTPGGGKVLACAKGLGFPAGQFGTKCPGGPAAGECDGAAGFVCEGAGPGDLTAYCTKLGCSSDSDCATGYRCATVRETKPPCTAACGLPAGTGDCVATEQIGNGKPFSCGPKWLWKNLCLARDYCAGCQSDDDCRALPNQRCAKDASGAKICTVSCDPEAQSPCPWGNASKCAVHDPAVGPTCAHRFGSCAGTGKSCEPCVDELDCPNGFCLTSMYTNERYCVDLGQTCSCAGLPTTNNVWCSGGGCPLSPGGLTLQCFGGSSVPTTSAAYDACFAAEVSGNVGCWPP